MYLNSIATCTAQLNGSKHKSKERRALEGPQTCHYCNVTVKSKSDFERNLCGKAHKKVTKNKYRILEND